MRTWAFGLLVAQGVANVVIARFKSPMQEKYAVAAHQLVCFTPFMFAAKAGLRMWLYDPVLEAQQNGSYAARYFECTVSQHDLVRMMLGFQIYDILATALVPELRKFEHLAHHIITGIFACLALYSGSLQHYAWFFFGIAEISSCFLVYVDLFRQCPGLLTNPLLSGLNEVARASFGVTFVPVRCVLWPLVVLGLLQDILAARAAADPRLNYAVATYHLTTSVIMTLLQQYWGQKVVRGILKMVKGDKSGRDKEN